MTVTSSYKLLKIFFFFLVCGGDWVVWAFMPFYVQNYFYCLYIQLGMFNIYISICRLKMYMVDYTMQPKSVQSDRRKQRKGLCYSLLANTSMPIMHFDFGATPLLIRLSIGRNTKMRRFDLYFHQKPWFCQKSTRLYKMMRFLADILPALIFKAGGKSVIFSFNNYISFTL